MNELSRPPLYINEYFHMQQVAPADMDKLWANGWRHFGTYFFRYNLTIMAGKPKAIIALRTDLHTVTLSKSQRRNKKRNSDLTVKIQPVAIDDEKKALFERHRHRFDENVPPDIYTFMAEENADQNPCHCLEVGVYNCDNKLLAVSFMDVGEQSISSVYALFDPRESKRGLGIYTMLLEIEWGKRNNKSFYYTGYTSTVASRYDYKKRFYGLQYFDFLTGWRPFPRQP